MSYLDQALDKLKKAKVALVSLIRFIWNRAIIPAYRDFFKLISVAFTIFFVMICVREYRDNNILVEPFVVSDSLKAQGYTGELYALKLVDQFNKVSCELDKLRGKREQEYLPAWNKQDFNLELGVAKVSLRSLIGFLRPDRRSITGDVSVKDDELIVTARLVYCP